MKWTVDKYSYWLACSSDGVERVNLVINGLISRALYTCPQILQSVFHLKWAPTGWCDAGTSPRGLWIAYRHVTVRWWLPWRYRWLPYCFVLSLVVHNKDHYSTQNNAHHYDSTQDWPHSCNSEVLIWQLQQGSGCRGNKGSGWSISRVIYREWGKCDSHGNKGGAWSIGIESLCRQGRSLVCGPGRRKPDPCWYANWRTKGVFKLPLKWSAK